jgi:ATP phosphoribosyltransferase
MNKIKIALPSKGRLKEESLKFFQKKNLKVVNAFGERNYFFNIKNNNQIEGIYLHAKEIIERINDGTLDMGISGLDLLKEFPEIYSQNVKLLQKLNFGFADLVVAVPKDWLDVQNMADLEEVSFEFKEKYGRRMRVATKYPNLTEAFFLSKGVSQFRIMPSLRCYGIISFYRFSRTHYRYYINRIYVESKQLESNYGWKYLKKLSLFICF